MNNTEQLIIKIKAMGCKANFKPHWDSESKTILLEVNKPAEILDGYLSGEQIDVYDEFTFRVWTHHKTKANACSARYKLIIRNMDGECELFIPGAIGDKLLQKFGAKIKKVVSNKRKAHLKNIGFKKHTLE